MLKPLTHTKMAMARELHTGLMRFRLCVWDSENNRAQGRLREERV